MFSLFSETEASAVTTVPVGGDSPEAWTHGPLLMEEQVPRHEKNQPRYGGPESSDYGRSCRKACFPHPQEPLGLRLRGRRNRGGGRFADFSFFGRLMHKKQII